MLGLFAWLVSSVCALFMKLVFGLAVLDFFVMSWGPEDALGLLATGSLLMWIALYLVSALWLDNFMRRRYQCTKDVERVISNSIPFAIVAALTGMLGVIFAPLIALFDHLRIYFVIVLSVLYFLYIWFTYRHLNKRYKKIADLIDLIDFDAEDDLYTSDPEFDEDWEDVE